MLMNPFHTFKMYAKNMVESISDRLGYCMIPKWRLHDREHARLLADVFKNFRIDCVLDVGANEGQFRDFLRYQVEYKGRIISFEPVKEIAAVCRRRAEKSDPLWIIMEMAVGDSESLQTMNVMQDSQLSSFLELEESEFNRQFFGNSFTSVGEKIHIEVRRLSSLLPELRIKMGFSRPFLKIDTQGFDLCVIEGCGEELSSIPAIQTELSVIPIYKNMANWTRMIDLLSNSGFVTSGLFPIHRDKGLRVVEFDGVFVKSVMTAD